MARATSSASTRPSSCGRRPARTRPTSSRTSWSRSTSTSRSCRGSSPRGAPGRAASGRGSCSWSRAAGRRGVPRGAPLPQLTIESGAAAELPDLADSWAWAHAQLLAEDSGGHARGRRGGASRAPGPQRVAARVPPAAGRGHVMDRLPRARVRRRRAAGPRRRPGLAKPLANAWDAPGEITLPVYFHWRFTTGPAGDFELLARRIKPFQATADIGRIGMHIGAAAPPLQLPDGSPDRFRDMDGALTAIAGDRRQPGPCSGPHPRRARVRRPDRRRRGRRRPRRGDPRGGRPAARAAGLRVVRDPPARRRGWRCALVPRAEPRPAGEGRGRTRRRGRAGEPGGDRARRLGPGGRRARRGGRPARARLGLEAARRFHERNLRPQPDHRLVRLAAPMAGRTRFGQVAPDGGDGSDDMPNPVLDGACGGSWRRPGGSSPRRRGASGRPAGTGLRPALVATLAAGRADVDATVFPRPARSRAWAPSGRPTCAGPGPAAARAARGRGARSGGERLDGPRTPSSRGVPPSPPAARSRAASARTSPASGWSRRRHVGAGAPACSPSAGRVHEQRVAGRGAGRGRR